MKHYSLDIIADEYYFFIFFFFSSRRRHTRCSRDWSSDVCSSDLPQRRITRQRRKERRHDDAIHGAGQSRQELRGGRHAKPATADRDGEVQRGAGEGPRAARGRGAPPELEGSTPPVCPWAEDRDRRALHLDEGD